MARGDKAQRDDDKWPGQPELARLIRYIIVFIVSESERSLRMPIATFIDIVRTSERELGRRVVFTNNSFLLTLRSSRDIYDEVSGGDAASPLSVQ